MQSTATIHTLPVPSASVPAKRPKPLVTSKTADCRKLPFMQIQIARLLGSREWMVAKRRPELGFHFINLTFAAFHEFPAGSLPNDDMVLADKACASDAAWAEIKDDVLEGMGWVLCSDGRWHHAFVADIVKDTLQKVDKRNEQTQSARKARRGNRLNSKGNSASVTEVVTLNVTEGEKKERERERESQTKNESPRRLTFKAEFDAFWEAYPHKVDRLRAESAFQRAMEREDTSAQQIMQGVATYKRDKPSDRQWMNPATFLDNARYFDKAARRCQAEPYWDRSF